MPRPRDSLCTVVGTMEANYNYGITPTYGFHVPVGADFNKCISVLELLIGVGDIVMGSRTTMFLHNVIKFYL